MDLSDITTPTLIGGFCVCLAARIGIAKFVKPSTAKRIVQTVVDLAAAGIFLATLVAIYLRTLFTGPADIEFDRKLWMSDKVHRFQMAEDIIERKLLVGMDTANLQQLLGEPTQKLDERRQWTFDMGHGGGGLGFLFHYLVVKLEGSRVDSVRYVTVMD